MPQLPSETLFPSSSGPSPHSDRDRRRSIAAQSWQRSRRFSTAPTFRTPSHATRFYPVYGVCMSRGVAGEAGTLCCIGVPNRAQLKFFGSCMTQWTLRVISRRKSRTGNRGGRALSLARRSRVVHADAGGLSRLTASSSSFAATVAPSVRIVPATAVARARVSGVRALRSAADRDSMVGVGPSCAAPIPRSATRPAQYGWSTTWGTTTT